MPKVEEVLDDPPETEDEATEELDHEADGARARATEELLARMTELETAAKKAADSLAKFTEQLPAVDRVKKEPVRDPNETGLEASDKKPKGDKAVQKVLDANPDEPDPDDPEDPEKKTSKSEWSAGKWIAGLTALVALGPSLMKILEGLSRILRGEPVGDILDKDVEAALRAFIKEHNKKSDAEFWADVAAQLKSKTPPAKPADLIYMFQFIAQISPMEVPYTWDGDEYDAFVAQVQEAYLKDKAQFVTVLPTLKGKGGAVPRSCAAALAQNAVALAIVTS